MSTKTVINPDGTTAVEKTPEPALKAASVAAAINTIAAVLATFGLTTWSGKLSGWAETIATIVVGVFTLAVHLGAGAWIRAHVVPLETVAKTTQGQLGGVLGELGPVLQDLHLTNNKVVEALEQIAYPPRSRSISVGGGSGSGAVLSPLLDGGISDQPDPEPEDDDGISDQPDPEPEDDDGISDEPEPEPEAAEDTPGADEIPPAGAPVLASHAKAKLEAQSPAPKADPTNPPEHSPR